MIANNVEDDSLFNKLHKNSIGCKVLFRSYD